MRCIFYFSLFAAGVLAQEWEKAYTSTAVAAVEAARATARTDSPTSYVKGKTFDRFVTIWCENTDYDMAAKDPNFEKLAKQGITLTNYYGVTHPSQPNYIAAVGGSRHGATNSFSKYNNKPDVKTVVDLLEEKGISWGEYQEDMPYSGFEGNYRNQKNGKNMYVRKHNGLMSYLSVTQKPERLARIKNFTIFDQDLQNNMLPQWMFITPNMTNNGHDSSITVAGKFMDKFVTPLLSNSNFMNRTLVLLTFDESEQYLPGQNHVFSVLLGDAIPVDKQGTNDTTWYDHYSQLKTVEENWGLSNLGKHDVDDKTKAFF